MTKLNNFPLKSLSLSVMLALSVVSQVYAESEGKSNTQLTESKVAVAVIEGERVDFSDMQGVKKVFDKLAKGKSAADKAKLTAKFKSQAISLLKSQGVGANAAHKSSIINNIAIALGINIKSLQAEFKAAGVVVETKDMASTQPVVNDISTAAGPSTAGESSATGEEEDNSTSEVQNTELLAENTQIDVSPQ